MAGLTFAVHEEFYLFVHMEIELREESFCSSSTSPQDPNQFLINWNRLLHKLMNIRDIFNPERCDLASQWHLQRKFIIL